MIRRLSVALCALLLAVPAWAQIPGGAEIQLHRTPITGGAVVGDCLTVGTGNTVSQGACSSGSVTTFSAGTTGFTPSSDTSGAVTLAGVLVGANGGTGVNNSGKTITLGGNLTTSGAFASTFTMTNTTSVTFPTSGTLATVGGNLGVFSGTSLALGGCTISTNVFCITGPASLGGIVSITDSTNASGTTSGALILSGGIGVAKDIRADGSAIVGSKFFINGLSAALQVAQAVTGAIEVNNGTQGTLRSLIANYNRASKTTNYQVVAADSNRDFDNTGAAGEVDFTLPASANVVAGQRYMFTVVAAQTVKIVANTGQTITIGNSSSSSAGSATNATFGSTIVIEAISTTQWIAISSTGTWTLA
jgi:hypothetical protein